MDEDVIGIFTEKDNFGRQRRIAITYDVKEDGTPASGAPEDILDLSAYGHPFADFFYEMFKEDGSSKNVPAVKLSDPGYEDKKAILQEALDRKQGEAEQIKKELEEVERASRDEVRPTTNSQDIAEYLSKAVEKDGRVDVDRAVVTHRWSWLDTEEAVRNIMAKNENYKRRFEGGGQYLVKTL